MRLFTWTANVLLSLVPLVQASMSKLNVLTATATDLKKAYEEGSLTSESAIIEYLNQISTCNGYLHAVIAIAPKKILLERARLLDKERLDGKVCGPLHGIPVTVKDNIATHPDLGMETTAGTFALVRSRVRDGAPAINQLHKAGAIILGKANLSELSNFRGAQMPFGWSAVGGLTQSPYVIGGKRWDDGFGGHSSTGGSSSGSCSSVAAGFAPVAIGTDTNGSILMPATRHDVYALKPTLGLISQEGICPISFDFDSAGPIAKSATDIAILMDTLVDPSKSSDVPNGGYTPYLTKSFAGIRIGVLNPSEWRMPPAVLFPEASAEAQMDREITAAYKKLESIGVVVKEVKVANLDGLTVDGMSLIPKVMDSQFKKTIETYLGSLETSKVRTLDELMQFMEDNPEKEFPPESPNMERLQIAANYKISDKEYKKALKDMRDWGRQAVDGCLKKYGVDMILGPGDNRINELSSAAGYPEAVLPLSYLDLNGRPFGVAVVASANQEALLIQLMSAWGEHFNTERRLPTWTAGDPHEARSEL